MLDLLSRHTRFLPGLKLVAQRDFLLMPLRFATQTAEESVQAMLIIKQDPLDPEEGNISEFPIACNSSEF